MAFAVTNLSSRQGIHTFLLNGINVKYDSTLDLLYTWTGGLAPTWGTPSTPDGLLRNAIINATGGVSFGGGLHDAPTASMPRPPINIEEGTSISKVDFVPSVKLRLGRIPVMRNNKRVLGIGQMPVTGRVDWTKTTPAPKKSFLEDMPTDTEELKDFLSDYIDSYGRYFRGRGFMPIATRPWMR